MKTVYFIRHAKSSWEDPDLSDFERPLNSRGIRDAPFMAKLFASKEIRPDWICSSSAVRALTTARYFAEALEIPKTEIKADSSLYLASEGYLLQRIAQLPKEVDTVCFFGHNPTHTYLANLFSDEYLENVPTAAIVKVQGEVEDWGDFNAENARFVKMHYPKQYFK